MGSSSSKPSAAATTQHDTMAAPSAAVTQEQRARGLMVEEEKVFKQVQKDHAASIKGLEKLTLKQKSIKDKADKEVAKLDKYVKEYEAQTDKDHKKV